MDKSPLDKLFSECEALGVECIVPTPFGVAVDVAPEAHAIMAAIVQADVALSNQQPLLPEHRSVTAKRGRKARGFVAGVQHSQHNLPASGQGRPERLRHAVVEVRERADEQRREALLVSGRTVRAAPTAKERRAAKKSRYGRKNP